MNVSSRRRLLIILLVAVLATVAFIFMNSLQESQTSWGESNAVATLFEPVLSLAHRLTLKIATWVNHPLNLTYEVFVRKCGHFAEYAMLGAGCTGITVALSGRVISPYLWADLFIVLMVAVLDEFVQSFVGRTSLVLDVLIDFSGSLTGIAIALVVAAIVLGRRRRYRGMQHAANRGGQVPRGSRSGQLAANGGNSMPSRNRGAQYVAGRDSLASSQIYGAKHVPNQSNPATARNQQRPSVRRDSRRP